MNESRGIFMTLRLVSIDLHRVTVSEKKELIFFCVHLFKYFLRETGDFSHTLTKV